jgi:hypothetical protein
MDPLQAMPQPHAPWIHDEPTATGLSPVELLAATVTTLIGLALPAVDRMREAAARMAEVPRLARLGGELEALCVERVKELQSVGLALAGPLGADGEGGAEALRHAEAWIVGLEAAESRARRLADEADGLAGESDPRGRSLLAEARTQLGVIDAIEAGTARALAGALARRGRDRARVRDRIQGPLLLALGKDRREGG